MQCTAISPSCSENKTVRELYLERHMSDCHLDVFSVCQEGEMLVRSMVVDVEEGEGVCECDGEREVVESPSYQPFTQLCGCMCTCVGRSRVFCEM